MSAQDAFREMEANGLHKQGEPTAAAAPDQEQQEKEEREGKQAGEEKVLPKLSAAEFRVYNRMAEHMDLFVRYLEQPHTLVLVRNLAVHVANTQASTTTSASHGTSYTARAKPAKNPRE